MKKLNHDPKRIIFTQEEMKCFVQFAKLRKGKEKEVDEIISLLSWVNPDTQKT